MNRARLGLIAAAVLAVGGSGTGLALAAGGGSPAPAPAAASQPVGAAASLVPAPPGPTAQPGYSWYRSMMGRSYGSYMGAGMMGGSSYGWMMGQAGYRWMLGEASMAPGWERGGPLSGFMMSRTDPGTVMGRLFADAPGRRVSAAQAARLGDQAPAGAQVNRSARTITFTTRTVRLVVLASPSMPAESFRIAGMTNPAITVQAGAQVTIELINADADMAHGLVVTASRDLSVPMPMMTARPAFPGSAMWFLGQPTATGMHAGTLAFTASAPGSYRYLCPVPGHAEEGMAGQFTVANGT